jgi:hypothetical protein
MKKEFPVVIVQDTSETFPRYLVYKVNWFFKLFGKPSYTCYVTGARTIEEAKRNALLQLMGTKTVVETTILSESK